jgi:toxin ParE1/3/4
MRAPQLEFHPQAIAEARHARRWYAERNPIVSTAFVAAMDHAIESIQAMPERAPSHLHGTRRLTLHRFPFSVVYRVSAETILIVAFAHDRREPGYWADR